MEIGSSLKFASDLIEFIMAKHGQPWHPPPRNSFRLRNVKRTFTNAIGELVYLYGLLEHHGCEAVFLRNTVLGNCAGDFNDYVMTLSADCVSCFSSQTLLLFFARVTVFVVLCYRNRAFDAPSFATTSISKALQIMEPLLLQIGGWPGLARDAEFYLTLPTYILMRHVVPWWSIGYDLMQSDDIETQFGLGSGVL